MNTYKINFDIDLQQWSQCYLSVSKPNLPQSWHYGDAKMKSQNWKLVRGIITENDKPIALIQAWYKKILFLKLVRVSYGPLWIIENPSSSQIKGVFYRIKKNWNLKKLSVLSIAPNLHNSPENIKILKRLHFFKRKTIAFESGLIDLKQPQSGIRAKLRANWRGHLNASEKKQLLFHASREYSDFQWLMSCFKVLRKEKNFYGHSIALLEALHNCHHDLFETYVTIVSKGNEKIAGMLIVNSGSLCTSLVTYVNKSGRTLHAGNFLLWNSVLYAKNKGCAWFDLGGTIENKFKTGLPHIPFQFIGEYYSVI